MIARGEKKEEYRDIKPYWVKRLLDFKHPEEERGENRILPDNFCYDINAGHSLDSVMRAYSASWKSIESICSRNGYAKLSPVIEWQHMGVRVGKPNPAWCEPEDVSRTVFILSIGKLL